MCTICRLFEQGKLTPREAKKASWEVVEDENIDIKHLQELYAKMDKLEKENESKQ